MFIKLDPMGGDSAGDMLAAPPAEGAAPAAAAKTITVPSDLLPEAKPGDTFKVQAVADGNVTLEHQPGAETDEDWGKGLQEAAPRAEEGV